jgi:hypothetical protein
MRSSPQVTFPTAISRISRRRSFGRVAIAFTGCCGPPVCSPLFQGFRHAARLGRISPPGWSLLPGAPALTRTGLAPARTTRLSGRTIPGNRNSTSKTTIVRHIW